MAFGLVVLADEIRRSRRWPARPATARRRREIDCAHADVGLRDQHVDGVDLRRRRGCGFGGCLRAAGQQGGDAAGGEGDDKHDDTRGFHTLHSLRTRRPARPRKPHGGRCGRVHGISPAKGQGMVKERYLNRVNIVLRACARRALRDRSEAERRHPAGVRDRPAAPRPRARCRRARRRLCRAGAGSSPGAPAAPGSGSRRNWISSSVSTPPNSEA